MFKYYLYIIARKLLLSVSLKSAYRWAELLAKVSYRLNNVGRNNVFNNLVLVFPNKDKQELYRISKRLFVNFTKYLVDFLRAEKLTSEFLDTRVGFNDTAIFDVLRAEHKNFIVVTAHLGNWELGGGVLSLRGFDMAAVARPHENSKTNKFFDQQRDFMSMEVIPLGIAVRRCFKVLKEGKVLALLGDKEFGNGGFIMDICGHKASIPKGPAALSLKFNIPLVPAFMLRNKDDNYDFFAEDLILPRDKNGNKRSEEDICKDYVAVIEKYIKKFPDQWFMFEPYFQSDIS